MDEINSQDDQQQANSNSAPVAETRPNYENDARSHCITPQTKSDPSTKSRFGEIIMIVATIVIAISTTIYTIYARRQWQVMSTTLSEMKSSGSETKTQIDRMITETNRIADSMSKTVQHSKKALDSTIENSHLEQRAWIGPTLVLPAEYTEGGKKIYIKEGHPINCGVVITNSGKTPALNVQHSIAVQALKRGEKPLLKETTGQRDISVLQPGTTLTIHYPPIIGVSKANVAALSSGQDILFMYGIIRYDDIFKKTHLTKFCMYLAPDLATFSSCPYYNETDDK